MRKSFTSVDNLVLGGDISFSIGASEVCGPHPRTNPLSDFFSHILVGHKLVDVDLIKRNYS